MTLIELLVVVCILAIAAAVVIPTFSSGADLRVMSAARLIATDLQYAQDLAVTFQRPVTVTFNVANDVYTLADAGGTLVHPVSKSAYVVDLDAQPGMERVDIVSANFLGNPVVTFDELGVPGNGGAVTVQAGAYQYTITVMAATGKVTVACTGS